MKLNWIGPVPDSPTLHYCDVSKGFRQHDELVAILRVVVPLGGWILVLADIAHQLTLR